MIRRPLLLPLFLILAAAVPSWAEVVITSVPLTPPAPYTVPPPAKMAVDDGAVVLPYFEVDRNDPSGETTMFAVRNNSSTPVGVRISYYDARNDAQPVATEDRGIGAHAVRTVNLRFVDGLETDASGISRGYVVVEPLGGQEAHLTGDYFRVDATGSEANGGSLVTGETTACRRWSHRFLSGGGFDGGTRIAFLALDPAPQGPTVVGNVFDEAGNQIHTVALTSDEAAFEVADTDLELPIPFGSIEWVFQGEGHGTVSNTFTANGLLSVGLEAWCVDDVAAPPGSTVFELPGNYLTCQGCGNWQYDMAFGGTRSFSKVVIDFDVFVAGWDPSRPTGWHMLFWLNNGPRWQDMMGYLNSRGTTGRTVFQVNGPLGNPIGVEQYASPTVQVGQRYHVHYEYDTTERVVWYEIRDAAGAVRVSDAIALPANVGPVRTNFAFIQFGSQPGGAVESLTNGWRWFDFRAVWIP